MANEASRTSLTVSAQFTAENSALLVDAAALPATATAISANPTWTKDTAAAASPVIRIQRASGGQVGSARAKPSASSTSAIPATPCTSSDCSTTPPACSM